MIDLAVLFWISIAAILYAYLGYPAVLLLISRVVRSVPNNFDALVSVLPSVSLIVSAFNEEGVIRQRIENALCLDYPSELLEIVVVSDGSTDRTCEIVLQFAQCGVVLRHYAGRIGKTECLNSALPLAAGSIVVLSDANSSYGEGALKALVRPFADTSVGFVTGCTKYGDKADASMSGTLGLYSRLELFTKKIESQMGSCIGADGAIFAIRKDLFAPLEAHDINDLVIPLSINLQGFRGVLQEDAICFEKGAGGAKGEFNRQVRITNRTIRAIINYRQLLNPTNFGLLSFQLFSHKLIKFLVPIFMISLLASNVLLLEEGSFFLAAFAFQMVCYLLAGTSSMLSKVRLINRISEVARDFVVINVAIVVAWIKYFQGETFTTWSPTRR